jgi:hypothetical protein
VAYQSLLQANSYTVDFVHMDDVATTAWNRYNLIVIGPETGNSDTWGTSAAIGALLQYPTPILGLGEGGYAFFGKVGLGIGYPNGWHGNEAFTYAMAPEHAAWRSPYGIPLDGERTVQVYKETAHVGIQVLRPPLNMVLIGREPANQTHYNLLQQATRYLLWGFQAGPRAMTGDGRHLFINVVRHLAGM